SAGNADQLVERALRPAVVDDGGGQFHSFSQGLDLLPDQEGGGGVEEHDVAIGAGLALQEAAKRLGVLRRRATRQVGERGALETDGLRGNGKKTDLALAELCHARL